MGRPAGSLNTSTVVGRQQGARYARAAEEFTFAVMEDRVKCSVCDGSGKQPVTSKSGKMHGRECNSCKGRGREIIKTETRLDAAKDIQNRFGVPTQKALEVSGTIDLEISGLVEKLAAGRARAAGLLAVPVRAVIEAAEEEEDEG